MARGLGRGLGALISDSNNLVSDDNETKQGITLININKIEPNKEQPRKYFDQELLIELAQSIKNFGVIQPLIVKQEDDFYTIIAGERRWRASKIAGLKEIPVIIKDYEKAEIIQIALIENIQRSDLNPIEEAHCYKKLIDEYFFTQDDISKKICKSRSAISSYISLLKLDERVQDLIIENALNVSLAKALLKVKNLDDQYDLATMIIEKQISLKNANILIDKYLESNTFDEDLKQDKDNKKNDDLIEIEEKLNKVFSSNVKIKNNKKNDTGKIEIGFSSKSELERLLLLFNKLS